MNDTRHREVTVMRTYDEAMAAAKDKRPFSNGTEGYAWTGEWCDECIHDRGVRNNAKPGDNGSGCPLLMVALMGKTPTEWMPQPWQVGDDGREYPPPLGGTYHCAEFVDDPDTDEGGGREPKPKPDPGPPPVCEGQIDMFEVAADQMLNDMFREQPVAVT